MIKNFKICFIALCALSVIMLSACKKDKDSAPQPVAFAYPQAKLEKRWTITNNNRTAGAAVSTLIAIEFVGNAYVLYFPGDSTVTGTCTTFDANYIVLKNYGTLQINTLSDTDFGFTLIVNGTQQKFTSAKATQTIADSDHTAKLCKTWRVINYTFFGFKQPDGKTLVTFNKYGTYLTNQTQYGVSRISTNTWVWSTTDEDSICYGGWDGGNITSCEDAYGPVAMIFTDNAKHLTMIEENEAYGHIEYELELK